MNCDFRTLEKLCQGAIGGLKMIYFTPSSNVTSLPTGLETGERIWNDADKVYSIAFKKGSARYQERPNRNNAGQSWTQNLTCSIPGAREEVERLIITLKNIRCHVFYTDNTGFTRYLYNVWLKSGYDSGGEKSQANEYTFTFSREYDRSTYAIAGNINPDVAPGGGGDDPPEVDDSCCITVNPVALGYVPATSGNANNRNELVTGSDGSIWFIDNDGRGFCFSRIPGDYEVTNFNKGFVTHTEGGNKRRMRIDDNFIPLYEDA